jgi:bifunctional DNA-binding transcriptional regulator/antitoxin component of YhaV-PrlF toxin-antitoxin module
LLGIAADTLTTTLADLTRWLLALRAGAIAGVAITASMAEPARLSDGAPVHYGLGLAVRRYRGLTVLCHTGSQPGYKAHIAYVPERDLGIAVLSNREDTRPAALAAAIMEGAIRGAFPRPHPAEAAARAARPGGLTAEQLAVVEGTYVEPETGEWATLKLEGGVLHAETLGDPLFLYDAGDGTFRDGDDYRATVPAGLRIELGSSRGEVICRLNLGGQRIVLRKYQPPSLSPEALGAFTGRYESPETDSQHVIRLEDGALRIRYGPGADCGTPNPMAPIAPDIFLVRPTAPGVAYRHVFRFERAPGGRVVSALVTMERLKSVRLWRAGAAFHVSIAKS